MNPGHPQGVSPRATRSASPRLAARGPASPRLAAPCDATHCNGGLFTGPTTQLTAELLVLRWDDPPRPATRLSASPRSAPPRTAPGALRGSTTTPAHSLRLSGGLIPAADAAFRAALPRFAAPRLATQRNATGAPSRGPNPTTLAPVAEPAP